MYKQKGHNSFGFLQHWLFKSLFIWLETKERKILMSEVIKHQIFHLQRKVVMETGEREVWEKKNEKGERRKWRAKRIS